MLLEMGFYSLSCKLSQKMSLSLNLFLPLLPHLYQIQIFSNYHLIMKRFFFSVLLMLGSLASQAQVSFGETSLFNDDWLFLCANSICLTIGVSRDSFHNNMPVARAISLLASLGIENTSNLPMKSAKIAISSSTSKASTTAVRSISMDICLANVLMVTYRSSTT